jgi:outer membrane protein OmpA-like peptidoglycan-associated protein
MSASGGRTPEEWAAYDRLRLIGALALGLLLLVLWLAGRGPGGAAACCSAPPLASASVPPPVASPEPPPSTLPPAPTPDPCAGALESDVLFATNSSELTAEGRALLDRLAPCWRDGRFEVAGHTDATGTDAINQPLSERRARAVADHLVSLGVSAGALTPRGYGSSRPVASNATAEDRALNRRVELVKQ